MPHYRAVVEPIEFDDEEPLAGVLQFLNENTEDGEDGLAILEPFLDEGRQQQGTRPGAQVPGDSQSLEIQLSEEERSRLERETCDLIEEYRQMISQRSERDQEVLDSYAMIPNPDNAGAGTQSEQLVSEMTMAFVDAAHARLVTTIMGITPLMRVDPIEAPGFEGEEATAFASKTEHFINDYALYGPPDLVHQITTGLLRTTKIGTVVFFAEWQDVKRRRRFYVADSKEPQEVIEREGRARLHQIDNDKVIIWPPTVINWQDATFIGHEAALTPDEWRAFVRRFRIEPDLVAIVEQNRRDTDRPTENALRREGMEASTILDRKDLEPVMLTQLWCRMTLPGDDEPRAFQMILHLPQRKLLYVGDNPYFSEKFPYLPIRYKWSDSSAWGTGAGQEALWQQSADSAMWNLELDNLFAGAYWVVLRKAGAVYNVQSDDIRPGAEIVVDDMDDFKPVKMGGEAPELQTSRLNNYQRGRSATGLSSVLTGSGDPVMKSGAGTGSVLALIEQGDKKLRMVDSNIRTDLSDLYAFLLEMVAQYAPDGLYYRYASESEADTLRMLKWIPPRGEIGQMFRLRAQAPSVNSSDEQRKDRLMLLGNLAQQHIQIIDAMVTELLTTTNPAAIPRWKEMVISYLTEIHLQTVKLQEIPRVPELVPRMPAMVDSDQTINDLSTQNQELTGQIEQLQQQLQQLAQQGAAMAQQSQPAQPQMGMPPQGMPMMQNQAAPGGANGMVP